MSREPINFDSTYLAHDISCKNTHNLVTTKPSAVTVGASGPDVPRDVHCSGSACKCRRYLIRLPDLHVTATVPFVP